MTQYYVYALIDPINRVPFYIGKGCKDRVYSHLKTKCKYNSDKQRYIDNIRMIGLEPLTFKIVDNLDEKTAYDIEEYYIETYKGHYPLTNKYGKRMPPSRKGCKVPKEVIEKREATKRYKRSLGMYDYIKCSDEQKRKLREYNLGKEGPNKVYLDVKLLKKLYVDEDFSKAQICEYFKCGLGSLNRILHENSIKKLKIFPN
jgi:hypothetical protein